MFRRAERATRIQADDLVELQQARFVQERIRPSFVFGCREQLEVMAGRIRPQHLGEAVVIVDDRHRFRSAIRVPLCVQTIRQKHVATVSCKANDASTAREFRCQGRAKRVREQDRGIGRFTPQSRDDRPKSCSVRTAFIEGNYVVEPRRTTERIGDVRLANGEQFCIRVARTNGPYRRRGHHHIADPVR